MNCGTTNEKIEEAMARNKLPIERDSNPSVCAIPYGSGEPASYEAIMTWDNSCELCFLCIPVLSYFACKTFTFAIFVSCFDFSLIPSRGIKFTA